MKMDKVTESNAKVICEQIAQMMEEVRKNLSPIVTEKYSKEQFLLEDRMAMLIEALIAMEAFVETADMTPEEHEAVLIEIGGNPKEASELARKSIVEYNLEVNPEFKAKAMLLDLLLNH